MHEQYGYYRCLTGGPLPSRSLPEADKGNRDAKSPTCSPNANHGHTLGRMHIAHDDTLSLDTQIHLRASYHQSIPPFFFFTFRAD
jgi:hypothetical protein